MKRVLVGLVALTILSAACGDDDAASEASTTTQASTTTTTIGVEAALAEFCTDAEQYLEVLDGLGGALSDTGTTVGGLLDARDALGPARDRVVAAAEELEAAVASATDEGSTDGPEVEVAQASIDRLIDADAEFSDTVEGIDEDTPLDEAAIEVGSSAYQLEIAWLLVYREAGCVEDDRALAAVVEFVTALQTDLQTVGYYDGAIDGIYGPATVAAVKALQADSSLPETGLPDRATQAALRDALGAQESAHISSLQSLLALAGYYAGPVDGVPSEALDAAIRALQADYGLPVTGVVGPDELHAIRLAIAASVAPPATTTTAAPASTAPPASTTPPDGGGSAESTVGDLLAGRDDMTSLLAAVTAAGLDDVLTGEQALTVFAPTDDAFAALPAAVLDELVSNPEELTALLSYHVVEGARPRVQLETTPTVTTLEGSDLEIVVGEGGTVTVNGVATVVEPDLEASNGIVHVIDAVLEPQV